MTEDNNGVPPKKFSDCDYCPICGELIIDYKKKHICPEHILEEICRVEEVQNEEYLEEEEKSYGEKLDDAEFIMNYYDDEEYYKDDEEI